MNNTCQCGCGVNIKEGCTFVYGHQRKGAKIDLIKHPNFGMMGKHHSQKTRDRFSEDRRGSESHFKGKHHTQETKNTIAAKCSEGTTKRWEDSEYHNRVLAKIMKAGGTKPNGIEKKMIEILKSISSDFRYTGNGSCWISGMNPDFINEDRKQIIEVFGCYWHGCPEHCSDRKKQRLNVSRINKFKKLGYSVLVVWEHELVNLQTVIKRIEQWVN